MAISGHTRQVSSSASTLAMRPRKPCVAASNTHRHIHHSLHASRPPAPTAPLVPPRAGFSTHGSATGARGFVPPPTSGPGNGKKPPSNHLIWYREIVPAMLPVIAIGTGVFFALQLTQTHLSHSRSLQESQVRISHLEAELAELSARQRRQAATWGESLGRVLKHVTTGAAQAVEDVKDSGADVRDKTEEIVQEQKDNVRKRRWWWGGKST